MELKNSRGKKCCEKFTLKKNYFITNDVMCLAQCWRANNKLMRVLNECERWIYQTKSHLHQHTSTFKFQFNWFYRHSHVGLVCLCVSGSVYPLNGWKWLLPTCGHWFFERKILINVEYQRGKINAKILTYQPWQLSPETSYAWRHDRNKQTNEMNTHSRMANKRDRERTVAMNCHCAPHWYTKQCQRKSGKTHEAA